MWFKLCIYGMIYQLCRNNPAAFVAGQHPVWFLVWQQYGSWCAYNFFSFSDCNLVKPIPAHAQLNTRLVYNEGKCWPLSETANLQNVCLFVFHFQICCTWASFFYLRCFCLSICILQHSTNQEMLQWCVLTTWCRHCKAKCFLLCCEIWL